MLDKPLDWLRVTARAAAERLGVAKGLSYADEDRLDALDNHPGGLDAAIAELGA